MRECYVIEPFTVTTLLNVRSLLFVQVIERIYAQRVELQYNQSLRQMFEVSRSSVKSSSMLPLLAECTVELAGKSLVSYLGMPFALYYTIFVASAASSVTFLF